MKTHKQFRILFLSTISILLSLSVAATCFAQEGTWKALDSIAYLPDIEALDFGTDGSSRIYSANASGLGYPVFTSTDRGVEWLRSFSYDAVDIDCMEDDDLNAVYICRTGGNAGVYFTDDGGSSWEDKHTDNDTRLYCVDIYEGGGALDTVFVGCYWNSGNELTVYYTKDGGDHWDPAQGDLPQSTRARDIIVADYSPDTIYIAVDTVANYAGVWRGILDDEDWEWDRIFSKTSVHPENCSAVECYCIAINPSNPEVMYVGLKATISGQTIVAVTSVTSIPVVKSAFADIEFAEGGGHRQL
jgi:hypothetical protein